MDERVNNSQPAGQAAQTIPGEIVSGQPSGGPDDLVEKAREGADVESARDPLGAGIDAFALGVPREGCPYPVGDTRAEQWLDGWDRQAAAAQE